MIQIADITPGISLAKKNTMHARLLTGILSFIFYPVAGPMQAFGFSCLYLNKIMLCSLQKKQLASLGGVFFLTINRIFYRTKVTGILISPS